MPEPLARRPVPTVPLDLTAGVAPASTARAIEDLRTTGVALADTVADAS